MDYQIELGADEHGPYRIDNGCRMDMPWSEVTRISAAVLDCITKQNLVIEIDHESGHFLEFNDSWPGFDAAIAGIAKYLKVDSECFERTRALKARDEAIVLWSRDDT
jgi:hypothetical protein